LNLKGEKVKKQIKENLSVEISALKSALTKLKKDWQTAASDAIRTAFENEIAEKEQVLAELVEELDTLKNQQRNNVRDNLIDLIKEGKNLNPLIKTDKYQTPRHHLAYIATDAKYIVVKNYSTTEERVNLTSQYLTHLQLAGVLNNLIGKPGHFSLLDQEDLRTAFETAGASYMIKTASFDEPKWDKKYVFNVLEVQRHYWAPIDRGTAYNELFDDLIYSLAGGKQENIDYIESWVAYKYLNPDKVKITPGLNITGKPGGNGKGLFTLILTSIFTPMGVTVIKGKNLTGGFNSIMEGKVITVLDDERRDRFPQDELKQNSGNGSIVIEPKGVDAYSVDATATTIVLDNTGLVRLVGGGSGGEDRRWSIITTELTLLETLQNKYNFTEDQAKQLAEQMGKLFENRIECGLWVAAMIQRHGTDNMPVLLPHHAGDYQARLVEQKDNYADVFERILPIMVNQGLLPFRFLKEIIEAETGEKIRKPQLLSSKFDEFLSRKGHKNVEKTDVNVRITFGDAIPVERYKGSIRRLRSDADTFDYGLISTRPYSKRETLTRETIQIHDFTQETADFLILQNQPRYPATPLKNEESAKNLIESTVTAVEVLAGLNPPTPLNPAKTVENLTRGALMQRFFESRQDD
jgi:uncharacterized protein YukE